MNCVIVMSEEIKNKSDFYYQINDEIYHIKEGTGDALTQDDIDAGIVDYIYYDCYKSIRDIAEDNICDGGCILLTKLYKDMTLEEIIATVVDFITL